MAGAFAEVLAARTGTDPDVEPARLLAHLARPRLRRDHVQEVGEALGVGLVEAAAQARWGFDAGEAVAWRAGGAKQDHVAARLAATGLSAREYAAVRAGARPPGWSRIQDDLRRAAPAVVDKVEADALAAGASADRASSYAILVQGYGRSQVVALREAGVDGQYVRGAREAGVDDARTMITAVTGGMPLSWAAAGS